MIPRKIWSYWDDPDNMPEVVKLSNRSWEKHNKGFEINLLNKNTWRKFVPDIDLSSLKFNDSQQRFSDFLRLYLLRRYGGIWLDASMICFSPLTNWMAEIEKKEDPEFIGFCVSGVTTDHSYPVTESWFIACKQGSLYINEVYHEFFHSFTSFDNIDKYFESLEKLGVNFHNIGKNHYLAVYLCFQKVLQKSKNRDQFRIKVISAEDERLGPMYYMVAPNDGMSDVSNIMKLCTNDKTRTALVKLRKEERQEIEDKPELHCVFKMTF